MKIFHLADLHLGKSVFEHSLLPDQRLVLNQVTAAVRAEGPAALIVAGDVFDRAVPPPEAVRLFGDFLSELKSIDPALVIAIIPGNHDSAARLAFASGILGLSGVHIRAEARDAIYPVLVRRDGEQARLWLLPFLNPGALPPEFLPGQEKLNGDCPPSEQAPDSLPLRSQAELFSAAVFMIQGAMKSAVVGTDAKVLQEMALGRDESGHLSELADRKGSAGQEYAEILVCHAFATGGGSGESERVFLGTAELVDPVLFERFDYVALGHLHRSQSAGVKGRYAGSPLAYAFSEGQIDRGFLAVEVRPGSFSTELRRIQPLRRMQRIHGSYDQVLRDPRWQEFEGDYIEAILDDADTVLNPLGPLRERFPFLLSLRQAAFGDTSDESGANGPEHIEEEDSASALDDFIAFHQQMRGCPPDTPLMELFNQLYREATSETP